MTDTPRKRIRTGLIAALVVAVTLLFAYPLSYGPVHARIYGEAFPVEVSSIYAPLDWLANHHSPGLWEALNRYVNYCWVHYRNFQQSSLEESLIYVLILIALLIVVAVAWFGGFFEKLRDSPNQSPDERRDRSGPIALAIIGSLVMIRGWFGENPSTNLVVFVLLAASSIPLLAAMICSRQRFQLKWLFAAVAVYAILFAFWSGIRPS